MADSALIRNIQTLTDLKDALGRFAQRIQEALRSTDSEIARTQEWVQQRVWHWQRQTQRAQQALQQAQEAVHRCRSQVHVDRDGRRHPPDCRAQEQALRDAERYLRETQDQLGKAQRGKAQLETAVSEYRRHASRLPHLAGSHTPRARASLARTQADLENYLAAIPPSDAAAAAYREMQGRIAGASPGVRGSAFETWAQEHVFGHKRRITVRPEDNMHLERIDDEGLGLLRRRTSDNYVDEDGSLWDAKAYGQSSVIDEEQLRDYDLMATAPYIYDSEGNRIQVTSINYLFSNRAAAEANCWRLEKRACVWYVDDAGGLMLLEPEA